MINEAALLQQGPREGVNSLSSTKVKCFNVEKHIIQG